ncbi:MAG: hypothetical protein DME21_13175 [Verrucomicrobia bacterium]|nr:MAG: hypothetical protein DME21_13175 [Verrucomicrobiota bacterium]
MRCVCSALTMVIVLVANLAGCQSLPPADRIPPTLDPAKAAALSPDIVSRGAKLYSLKCARCHKFYNPADYGDAEWHGWMTRMSKKAHLESDEREILVRYLDAFRSEERALEH